MLQAMRSFAGASARAADADVLGDHLEERQGLGVGQRRMKLGRHLDEAIDTRRTRWQRQDVDKALSANRRIPLDDDHFGVEARPAALGVERVDEGLESPQRIAAVIVVARRKHYAQVGFAVNHGSENDAP